MSGPGHNDAGEALRGLVARLQKLDAKMDEVRERKKAVMAEAKGSGFDPKIIRIVLQRRKMGKEAREERDEMIALYENDVG